MMPNGRARKLLRENGFLSCRVCSPPSSSEWSFAARRPTTRNNASTGRRSRFSVIGYLTTGDFVEAMFENWEPEFLQMGLYVVLTALVYQKGSSVSKPLQEPAPQDGSASIPWPSHSSRCSSLPGPCTLSAA
jgi:hypothetical protein